MTNPESRFTAGGCTATVFVILFRTPDEMKTAKNVVLERTYKDKNGAYQVSKSFSMNDIPKAILVLQKAYEHIVSQRAEPSLVPKEQQHLSAKPSL